MSRIITAALFVGIALAVPAGTAAAATTPATITSPHQVSRAQCEQGGGHVWWNLRDGEWCDGGQYSGQMIDG